MRKGLLALALLVVLLVFSGNVLANPNSYPVDIPGTDLHFFSYRFEGDVPPFEKIEDIWKRLGDVIQDWVEHGREPLQLTADHVEVKKTSDNQWGVYLKGQLIVIADQYHAQVNRSTSEKLSKQWAANLAKGIEAFTEINVKK